MKDSYSLGFLIGRASVALSKQLNASIAAEGIDLPHSQFIVLRCLYFNDDLSQLDIAHLLSKDAAAIKRTIDNLEEKNLVARKQVRTLKNSVCITEEGRALIPRILKIAQRIIDKALSDIDKEDRVLLFTMLNKIYVNLENK
jgi:DNA-binding MarR family transcriptional regulator